MTGHNRKVQTSIYAANEIRSTLYVCLNGIQFLQDRPARLFSIGAPFWPVTSCPIPSTFKSNWLGDLDVSTCVCIRSHGCWYVQQINYLNCTENATGSCATGWSYCRLCTALSRLVCESGLLAVPTAVFRGFYQYLQPNDAYVKQRDFLKFVTNHLLWWIISEILATLIQGKSQINSLTFRRRNYFFFKF